VAIFPSVAAKEGHTMDIRKPFRRVVSAAGLNPDEIVRHTLRHIAVTHLVQVDVGFSVEKRISGHKALIMVERYAHQNGEHIKAAMDKLENPYQK
jgi:site-specific recombinase XerD